MPNIIDNEHIILAEQLSSTLKTARRTDFCVGYFNLRGWNQLADLIDTLPGEEVFEEALDAHVHRYCRLLVGMHKAPDDLIKDFYKDPENLDNRKAAELRKRMAQEFRRQLTVGYPTDRDEQYLKKLSSQIKDKRLTIKLYLKNTLHAKLYLAYTTQNNAPIVGYVGSSNLTFAGLSAQGELNVDVVDNTASKQLRDWFEERWNDRWCVDISEEVADIIDNHSWVQQKPPYYIYLKIAYHLSQEARAGLNEFRLPKVFEERLLTFQQQAVKIAAYHLHKRGGVIIGDVVGLGKTITAAAVARVFQEDFFYKTLIICPPNLKKMWDDYKQEYDLHADIVSVGTVHRDLKDKKRYKLLIVDESHNLRNHAGKRYKAIKEYISDNDCKVVLLSATPYNKSFRDIANQLGLFIPEDADLGISPEHFIESLGGPTDFFSRYPEIFIRGIKAFELSDYADDWRELLRFYMVRRTRSFVKNNYAEIDPANGRFYLTFPNGDRSYFPDRIPKKVEYDFDPHDAGDQYARLYSPLVADVISELALPRYGLRKYIHEKERSKAEAHDAQILENLSRAGERLRGFCRTNLFKRLESSGWAFLLSLSRHVLRNYVAVYAIQNKLPIPIGTHITNVLDELIDDQDMDDNETNDREEKLGLLIDKSSFLKQAEKAYVLFQTPKYKERFDWIDPRFFTANLLNDLERDAANLTKILQLAKNWSPDADRQLNALHELLTGKHRDEKVLIFTQFADTADYLYEQLRKRGIQQIGLATGNTDDPTLLTYRFSPVSNKKDVPGSQQLRVLIATDVLSEGQNLQDAHIVLNYDLPWAIIRLIQRAGRVDRIGQKHDKILCYSFLPEDGIENIIRLRSRLANRIRENAEVVGSDEVFFDGDPVNIQDIYSEKSGILDEVDSELDVDLSSFAFQIWKDATDARPELKKIIPDLPNVSYSTKPANADESAHGVILYARTTRDNDVLTWLAPNGSVVTQSQFRILRAAACNYETPPPDRRVDHHDLVRRGLELIHDDERNQSGTLGKRTSAKYKVFHRLTEFIKRREGELFAPPEDLKRAVDVVWRHPLREYARETLNRELRAGIKDEQLAELVLSLWEQGKLVIENDDQDANTAQPHILCSLGII
jgi:superfamily II DNA or RNA helicase